MFDKQGLTVRIFFVIAIISAGSVILPLWNYSRFYLAWSRFDYVVEDVAVNATQAIETNRAQVNVTFLVTNPTDYSGLSVIHLSCDLEYLWTYHSTSIYPSAPMTPWWDLRTILDTQTYPLRPNSQITISLTLLINPIVGSSTYQSDSNFISFLGTESGNGNIQWFLGCDLVAGTFLGGLDAGSKDVFVNSTVIA